MRRRHATTALLAALALTAALSGCATTTGTATTIDGVPQMDARVASSLDDALDAVTKLPGVQSATKWIELHQSYTDASGRDVTPEGLDLWNETQLNGSAAPPPTVTPPGDEHIAVPPRPTPTARPTPPPGSTEHHSFTARLDVAMAPGATAAQAGAVPSAMAERIAWTGVSLNLTLAAGANDVAPTVTYNGAFDQTIPLETATGIASGAMIIAAAPGVTWLDISIPMTMRPDYGQLNIEAAPPATEPALRAVVATTIFRDTTTHGFLPNGAKP